jgi:hypothetical protein
MMARGRGAAAFWAVVAGLWLVLAVMAYLTPIILDDWYQVGWLRTHDLTISGVLGYARYNYFHYNPRLGETLLLVVNGPRVIHVVLTPLVELALVFVVHAIALGRWPAPNARDARAIAIIQALLWLAAPAPGLLWFYRPFTTNYLYGFTLQLSLFAPYRFALAGRVPASWWRAPAMLALGFAAGMTNEHTGPSSILALGACVVIIARRHAIARWAQRAWLAAGALGLFLGYAALYFAPGQHERYGGTAAGTTPLGSLADRGLEGGYTAFARLFVHAQLAPLLAFAVIVVAAWRARRRGEAAPGLDRDRALAIAGLVAWASAITGTLLLSPLIGERMYFAPAVLLIVACVIAIDAFAAGDRAVARAAGGIAAAVLAVHAVVFVRVQLEAHDDAADRYARLERAAPGSIAVVPPFHRVPRSRWFWGDDFVYASLREYVAHEVFGLGGIEIEGAPRWAEPTPPYRFAIAYRYESPLDRAALAAAVPLPDYTPTFWEWVIAQQRKLLPSLVQVGDHALREIDVTVVSDDPAVRAAAQGRPIYADRWRDGRWSFVYGRHQHDPAGWPRLSFVPVTLPDGLHDSYLIACGTSAPITVDAAHTDVDFAPRCESTHVALLCTPTECWLGGTVDKF